MTELVARFKSLDVTAFPDVHLLTEDLDAVLWVLLVADKKLGMETLTAAQIASVLTRACRRGMTRQRVASLLASARGLVASHAENGVTTYSLMRTGADRLQGAAGAVVIVDPSSAFSALRIPRAGVETYIRQLG